MLAVATMGGLGTPGVASAGGIDPTRECVEQSVRDGLTDRPTLTRLTATLEETTDCGRVFVAHVTDRQRIYSWAKCLEYGLARSIPPLTWDPFLSAVQYCTEAWLQFSVQVDPYPR